MNISVLSGKGGTGKTFVSVNLAAAAKKSVYVDCDVEEPNGYLFFKPENLKTTDVFVKIPFVDAQKCDGCRKCVDFCKFSALVYIKNNIHIFNEVCHSCGGCMILCPQGALSERYKKVGTIEEGVSENVEVFTGRLNIGDVSGVPIINEIMEKSDNKQELRIVDCPPGSACVVMDSIKDADYCILVAEPTLFGAHNLNMVYELVQCFDKPFGVVLNKCIEGDNPSEIFCIEHDINILAKIPFDKQLGDLTTRGKIVVREKEEYKKMFENILDKVTKEVQS